MAPRTIKEQAAEQRETITTLGRSLAAESAARVVALRHLHLAANKIEEFTGHDELDDDLAEHINEAINALTLTRR